VLRVYPKLSHAAARMRTLVPTKTTAIRVPLALFLRKISENDPSSTILDRRERYTVCVEILICWRECSYNSSVGSISGNHCVFLGGEHWTDTLLFRFNLYPIKTAFGQRRGVEERQTIRLGCSTPLFRQMYSVASNQVESSSPTSVLPAS
jgi:hypothetical protein